METIETIKSILEIVLLVTDMICNCISMLLVVGGLFFCLFLIGVIVQAKEEM